MKLRLARKIAKRFQSYTKRSYKRRTRQAADKRYSKWYKKFT